VCIGLPIFGAASGGSGSGSGSGAGVYGAGVHGAGQAYYPAHPLGALAGYGAVCGVPHPVYGMRPLVSAPPQPVIVLARKSGEKTKRVEPDVQPERVVRQRVKGPLDDAHNAVRLLWEIAVRKKLLKNPKRAYQGALSMLSELFEEKEKFLKHIDKVNVRSLYEREFLYPDLPYEIFLFFVGVLKMKEFAGMLKDEKVCKFARECALIVRTLVYKMPKEVVAFCEEFQSFFKTVEDPEGISVVLEMTIALEGFAQLGVRVVPVSD